MRIVCTNDIIKPKLVMRGNLFKDNFLVRIRDIILQAGLVEIGNGEGGAQESGCSHGKNPSLAFGLPCPLSLFFLSYLSFYFFFVFSSCKAWDRASRRNSILPLPIYGLDMETNGGLG